VRRVPEIVAAANEASRLSRTPGAPLLSENSSLVALLAWCDWNDPNGEWLAPEACGVANLGEAWDRIECMLFDDC